MVKSRYCTWSNMSGDLEFKMVASFHSRRMTSREMESGQNRKSALLEGANGPQEKAAYRELKHGRTMEHILREPCWTFGTRKHFLVKEVLRREVSAFTEVRRSVEKEAEQGAGQAGSDKAAVQGSPLGSAFSPGGPSSPAGETKSAFHKPAKCWGDGGAPAVLQPLKGAREGSPRKGIAAADLVPYGVRLTPGVLLSDLDGFQLLSSGLTQGSPLASSLAPWPKEPADLLQASLAPGCSPRPPASWALLPPTFAPLGGEAAQNWCAKCRLSFHLTSDLVLHMRSCHTKADSSAESQRKRRRGEALPCPVCQEYFRERHHLSRHMTSHS